ncbi:hypothetical protein [Kangiella aquimarina]|uniref:Uncharacterized protein n=1 Tax=Kangiella aquimarina TaxID=261965 RepID=A0ABZ0X534_9GAMM|nr:hypothetical protein [Kangiella aquimarina]WQG85711.1 hypothetical protein SR900_02215 [Kangiella aquimarina]
MNELINELQGYFRLLRRLSNNTYHYTARYIDINGGVEESLLNFYDSIGLKKRNISSEAIKSVEDLAKCVKEMTESLDRKFSEYKDVIEWDIHEYVDMLLEREIEKGAAMVFHLMDKNEKRSINLVITIDKRLVLINASPS